MMVDTEPCCPEGCFRSGLADVMCWLAQGSYLLGGLDALVRSATDLNCALAFWWGFGAVPEVIKQLAREG